MKLGNWDIAVLKSVFLTAFLVLAYALYEMDIPNDLDDLAGFGMFMLLFTAAYLAFSAVGWLLFGFPVHWLICKYGNGSYFSYLAAVCLFTILVYLFAGVKEAAFIYGFFAMVQAFLFKYYAYKQPKT